MGRARTLALAALVVGSGVAGVVEGASSASAVSAPTVDGSASAAASDPQQVFDPAGVTSSDLGTTADEVATSLSADLHVRVEGTLDGDIDGREAALESGCPGWLGANGLRASNLLVVMVSPNEHQTSIYYGSDYADTLISADPDIQQDVMNPDFQRGDVEQGLVDGLQAIETAVHGGGVPQAFDSYDSYDSNDSSGGVPGIAIFAFVALVVIGLGYTWLAQKNGWSTSSSSGDGSGTSRLRGFNSFGSRSSSYHSSSSSHAGSSSHHSGGGGSSSHW
ncbi:MAG: hypothetical protein JWM34_4942 [Ilumatobacteraceae bacterium]|nr:hypothetical protein [Ilumatobacteraceae bacterium]